MTGIDNRVEPELHSGAALVEQSFSHCRTVSPVL